MIINPPKSKRPNRNRKLKSYKGRATESLSDFEYRESLSTPKTPRKKVTKYKKVVSGPSIDADSITHKSLVAFGFKKLMNIYMREKVTISLYKGYIWKISTKDKVKDVNSMEQVRDFVRS